MSYAKVKQYIPWEEYEKTAKVVPLFSSMIMNHDCPRCGAPKGHYCRYPSGRTKRDPHIEREPSEEEVKRSKAW